MASSSDLIIALRAVDEASGAINRVSGSISTLETGMHKTGRAAMRAGTEISFLSAPLAAIGIGAIKTAAEFESGMNLLQATTGSTADQMAQLSARAIELGGDMTLPSTSAVDAGEAMLELSKAGLSVNDTLTASRGVLQLAAAANISNADAARIAANALNTFHLSGSAATDVANMLANAANASSADVTDLSQGVQQGGFAFAAAKMPLQDLITSVAALSNVGLTGSDAGTALKNAIMRLMDPTKEATKLMASLGLEVFDASGTMLSLPQILTNINAATAGMSDQERNAALATIFLSDGMKAMIPLLDLGTTGFNALKQNIEKEGGAADLANARTKGLEGAIEGLKSTIETMLLTQGTPFLDFFANLIRKVADAVAWFGNLPAPIQNAAIAIGAILAIAGPLVLLFGAMATGISAIISVVSVLAPAFGILAGAAGLVTLPVLAIVAAIGLLIALVTDAGGLRTTLWDLSEAFRGGIGFWISWTRDRVNDLVAALGRLKDAFFNIPQNISLPSFPSLPGFAAGGMVPGPIGAPMLAMVHGGETVTPPGGGVASSGNFQSSGDVYLDGQLVGRVVWERLLREKRLGTVLGLA